MLPAFVQSGFVWSLRFALLSAIFYSFYVRDFLFVFGALLALLLSLLPAFWKRRLKARLPLGLETLTSLALFMHIILGEVYRFYDQLWYFDKIMHFYGTGLIALLAFLFVFTLHWSKKVVLTLPFIALFTVIFSVAVGSLWEICEFSVDKFFARNTQYSLDNTMYDIIFNFIGGISAAIFGTLYTKWKNPEDLNSMMNDLKRIIKS